MNTSNEVFDFKSDISKSSGNFSPLPINRYDLYVLNSEATKSKEKGTPQIAVTFGVLNNESFKNRKIFHNFTWTKAASPFVYNFMKTVKSELIEKDGVTMQEVAANLIGKRVSAFVDIETTNSGNNRNKVSDFKEYTGTAVAPVTGGTTPPAGSTGAATDQPLFR